MLGAARRRDPLEVGVVMQYDHVGGLGRGRDHQAQQFLEVRRRMPTTPKKATRGFGVIALSSGQ